jgi:CHAD domain-containing protein
MSQELRNTESGTRGVRRIVRKQTEKALEILEGEGGSPSDKAVHDARKQLKKVRAGLRLLRPALGSSMYDRENARFRDAAHPLTEVRDARVLTDTLDQLAEKFGDELRPVDLDGLRRCLRDHYEQVRRQVTENGDSIGHVKEALAEARDDMEEWPVGRKGWSALGRGLKRVYRRGRDAFKEARGYPSVENLHEWRKQTKYLWHQIQVLEPMRPEELGKLAELAHTLADHLGDDHDLSVLLDMLLNKRECFPDADAVAALVDVIVRRQAELRERAWEVGGAIYGEQPKDFADRLRGYWKLWKADSPRRSPARRITIGPHEPALTS